MNTKTKLILSRTAAYGIPVIVSLGLCYVLFTSIDFHEMAFVVREHCKPWWIAVTLAVSVLSHIFRAMRWRIQLRAIGLHSSLWEVTQSVFGMYAVNLVFPRLGELWRTTFISKRQGAPFSQVFGTMVAERLGDILSVLIITALTFVLASGHLLEYLRGSGAATAAKIADMATSPWLWSVLVAGVAGIWLFAAYSKNAVARKIRGLLHGLWQGFAIVATMPGRGRWVLLTAAIWGCYFLQLYVAFYAFPFTAALVKAPGGTVAALVAFTLSSISMGVPSNGGIGPWQWAVIFALGSYGIAAIEAGAFANVVLGAETLLFIALGLLTFASIAIYNKHHHNQPTVTE
ncbi:MAG: flippase-like domain-containing protein [Muribaculaceae bacterium]|nr:flippase-like domain-containing protein [Muribaculaceae bacterium]